VIPNYLSCPRCSSEWDNYVDDRRCNTCGMGRYSYVPGECYELDLYHYMVMWFFDDLGAEECHIYPRYTGPVSPSSPLFDRVARVVLNTSLPFDVSLDAVRIYFTFQ